jgi:hypothetical protein
MRTVIYIVGPPTDTGSWNLSIGAGEVPVDLLPGIGHDVCVRDEPPFVAGTVAHVQWHDDKVVLVVEADSLDVSPEQDWRAVLCPDVVTEHLVEEVEEWLEFGGPPPPYMPREDA